MVFQAIEMYLSLVPGPAVNQVTIECYRLVRDAGPGEVLLHPAAAGFAHAFRGGRVFEQQSEFGREVAGELLRWTGKLVTGSCSKGTR